MRILAISTAVALVAAGGVSAAVAAIPAGAAQPFVVERPAVTKRQDISRLASIIADNAHQKACIEAAKKNGQWDNEHCGTIFAPPAVDVATATVTTGPALVEREAGITELASIIASEAHRRACFNYLYTVGHWNTEHCGDPVLNPPAAAKPAVALAAASDIGTGHTTSSDTFDIPAPMSRRDALADPTTTSWVTITSTSTIAMYTTTMPPPLASNLLTYGRPIPTPPDVSPLPNFNLYPVSILSTSTDATRGIRVVQVTVTQTIRVKPSTFSTGCTTTPPPSTWSPTTSCLNNTSIDTNSYLNISTWSMTGYNASTAGPASNSISPYFTEPSSLLPLTTKPTMTGSSSGTADISGFKGGVTSTLGSSASHGNAVDLSNFHFPAGAIAAMGACFALALFL